MALASRTVASLLLRGRLGASSSLTGVGGVPATCSCGSVRDFAAQAPQKPEDDDTYELLPPGCSLADPTYGRSFGRDGKDSLSDPVLMYDQKPVEDYRPLKKPLPAPPLNLSAAQAKLQESKDAKKRAKQEADDEDGLYVYLPPGSSMRDPVSLPNSMSDPLDNRRVYYRDPSPTIRSK